MNKQAAAETYDLDHSPQGRLEVSSVIMGLKVLVIDETLGQLSFVKQLLEDLEHVAEALVVRHPAEICLEDICLDVFILGATWLDRARELRQLFPGSFIVGRGPWQGESGAEFFPWGDELREPSLPITHLIPA